MKLKIKCGIESLERSLYCSGGENCWIALAIRDIFPHAHVTARHIDTNYYLRGDGNLADDKNNIRLPEIARDMIFLFDHTLPSGRINLEPFEFTIEVPESVIEKIGLSEIERILSESKTLEKVT